MFDFYDNNLCPHLCIEVQIHLSLELMFCQLVSLAV